MLTAKDIKQQLGREAADLITAGMIVGLGTGTTAHWLIDALGQRVREGLDISAVATSAKTAGLARQYGIPLLTLNEVVRIDLTIDGADEIDPQLRLIKGGGGALLQEKMVAAASAKLLIIADESKRVTQLGTFPLPVEVVPYNWTHVQRRLEKTYHIPATLRMQDSQPFQTDHGHYIIDCAFGQIADASSLSHALNAIPGVVDNGLFLDLAKQAWIGYPDGRVEKLAK
ncbi:MAG: ribose-5-phosphate isomerase RpiA [Candidatus Pseudobacter hemicellulosilyticus]|uniref:Ribose-5-phosphate isomerase A n=1 Tax=Candidatus Pseudobacter hemicellulosilyticus TaxID=3121375 RepID=A0AAJ5WTN0_9BACT|nr:MAG: ribose-5-phosphate isomerase RpiA [Pseudobacter sp.]